MPPTPPAERVRLTVGLGATGALIPLDFRVRHGFTALISLEGLHLFNPVVLQETHSDVHHWTTYTRLKP